MISFCMLSFLNSAVKKCFVYLAYYLLVQALEKCQLGDEVRRKEGKLDSAGNSIK